jgi:hypothetical protein
MKSYINNGNKIYDEKYLKIIKDILTENKFLRGINILPKNINNTYVSQLQKQIQIEKMKKELLIQKQFTKIEEKNQNNNSKNSKEIKDNNNPFNNDETSLNELSKGSHKRQRTHFNLGDIEKYNLSEKEKDSSISSTSTIVASEKDDILEETLRDILNYNKTLKRNNNSKKNITDKDNGKEEKKDVINTLNLSNKKQPQLYYRTPKEKIKIEFTK